MAEKFGIENLQKVLAFGVTLGTAVAKDFKTGFDFNSALQLLPQLSQIPELLKNKQAILDEAKDLSLPEIEQLVQSVEGVINNAQVTSIIEHGLSVVVSVAALIEDFKTPAVAPGAAVTSEPTPPTTPAA